MSVPPTSPTTLREALPPDATIDDLRTAIARVSAPVLITDRHAQYVAANAAACALTGFSEVELTRLALPDLTGFADVAVSDVLWRGFLDQGIQTGEYTLSRKDGSTVLVRYEALANIIPGYHASFLEPATR